MNGYGYPMRSKKNEIYDYDESLESTFEKQRDLSPVPVDNIEVIEILQQHLPILHMYSLECPLADVRGHCQKLLRLLEVGRIVVTSNGSPINTTVSSL